ncbi:LOW QUALITY PROTEIN: Hypothetical protein PHPALM_15352 [Phytophthora palmivora]|uniref:Reverse transcriptase domain-containing protein n=1 Tax=Phytophthora palmivora TaxID=4796 RepID=A0A2P4XSG4_9STRA|nr:LOW QUALITY PROTEIN: Hypothetical protein PHPALM_15352 [Phytophthora palmivora]
MSKKIGRMVNDCVPDVTQPFARELKMDLSEEDVDLEKDLRELVMSYADIFRLRLGRDEPADVESLEVPLVPGDQLYRTGMRRYPERQRQFLRKYVRELEGAGLVERNNHSRWSSPALDVAKQGTDEFRIAIDYRPVNKLTVPLASAAPNLALLIESVRGACGFGTFDFYKGFWQMPLHPNSRELFSFVTDDGVFTPTRVPQEASDSAVHFQSQMNEVMKGLLFHSVLAAKAEANVRKCKLFARHVKWCGKLIDGEGVMQDPERLAVTGLDDRFLQDSRPSEKLERVMLKRGRRKSQLSGATLVWTESEREAFRVALEMMERSCKLIFSDKGAAVCIFTDASLTVTQIRNWQDGVPVEQQTHKLLICRGGRFKKAQLNWSIVEKEGYPIGFHVYCDHSNLIKPFAPDTEVKAHVKGKLQRNLWTDIISRWGQPEVAEARAPLAIKRVTTRSGGLLAAKIVLAQQQHQGDAPDGPTQLDEAIMVDDKMWVPRNSKSLTKRLLVVAQCGNQGHRGLHVMVEFLSRHFALANLRQTVTRFINSCLLSRGRAKRVDYLYIGESYGNAKYVVVLKDELTHFCELVATDTADSHTEVAAIIGWN